MTECENLASCFAIYAPMALDTAFAIIAVASAVAALTPTPNDDSFVARVYRIVDWLALNVGHAKERSKVAGGRFVPR